MQRVRSSGERGEGEETELRGRPPRPLSLSHRTLALRESDRQRASRACHRGVQQRLRRSERVEAGEEGGDALPLSVLFLLWCRAAASGRLPAGGYTRRRTVRSASAGKVGRARGRASGASGARPTLAPSPPAFEAARALTRECGRVVQIAPAAHNQAAAAAEAGARKRRGGKGCPPPCHAPLLPTFLQPDLVAFLAATMAFLVALNLVARTPAPHVLLNVLTRW